MDANPICIEKLNHSFGQGALRRQVLFDVTGAIRAGEVVIVTGPSGSGKTTLLTLIGALRSAQLGSLRVLGEELNGAREAVLRGVRTRIGYVFQAHNLLDSLTAAQNVQTSLLLHPVSSSAAVRRRSLEMLEAVGLADRSQNFPSELSGGEKQRVAVARALVSRPRIILADEPTASLDKRNGREVVELMRSLANGQGTTVLMVTHDARVLDVADRILHLEDGHLSSLVEAVMANTQRMMELLAQMTRKGELIEQVRGLSVERFAGILSEATTECEQFLHVIEMSDNEAFQSMLEQALEAFTLKVGEILAAERASLFLVDASRGELWSKVAQGEGGRPLEIRMPLTSGIAGHVATTGQSVNIGDAYSEPYFNRAVDEQTGYRTHSVLCVPVMDRSSRVFAVAQLLNKAHGQRFDAHDEERLREFVASIGVVLESWWRMSRRQAPSAPPPQRAGGAEAQRAA